MTFAVFAVVAVAANFNLPGDYKLFAVQSGSMEPAIPTGSVVLTKPTSDFVSPERSSRFIPGDVITFANDKSIVSHRVVETSFEDGEFFYKTKGDANKTADSSLVAENNVIGKVKLTAPYFGKFVDFAKQPLGYFLLILSPSLYIILAEVWTIVSELRKTKATVPKYTIVMPILLLAAASFTFVGGTYAYFSDSVNSTDNVFQTDESFPQTANLYNSNPFTCPTGATNTAGVVYGSVTIDKDIGELEIQVILDGATPNSSYDIWVNQDPGSCPLSSSSFPGGLTTDSNGDVTEDFTITETPGAENFWISAVGGGQVLRSTAVDFE